MITATLSLQQPLPPELDFCIPYVNQVDASESEDEQLTIVQYWLDLRRMLARGIPMTV